MKNAIFRDMAMPRDSCKNGRFAGIYLLHLQGDEATACQPYRHGKKLDN
jgi:hypothetical protein